MLTRLIEKLVLALAVAGILATIVAFYLGSQVREEYTDCIAKIGRFDVVDQQCIHLRRLETENPNEFAWQYYLPPFPSNSGLQTKGFVGDARHYSNWRIAPDNKSTEGTMRAAVRYRQGRPEASGNEVEIHIRDETVARFVEQHWDALEFYVAGTDETLVQDRDKVVKLFEARLPADLVAKFTAANGPELESKVATPFAFYVGEQNAIGWPDKARK